MATKEEVEEAFYQDPAGFLENFRATIKKEVFDEVAGAYRQEQAGRDYWQGFYGQRPDLKEHGAELREHLAGREQAWIKEGITIGQSYDRLAEGIDESRTIREARLRVGSISDSDGNAHSVGGQVHARIRGKEMIIDKDGRQTRTLGQVILDRQQQLKEAEK